MFNRELVFTGILLKRITGWPGPLFSPWNDNSIACLCRSGLKDIFQSWAHWLNSRRSWFASAKLIASVPTCQIYVLTCQRMSRANVPTRQCREMSYSNVPTVPAWQIYIRAKVLMCQAVLCISVASHVTYLCAKLFRSADVPRCQILFVCVLSYVTCQHANIS